MSRAPLNPGGRTLKPPRIDLTASIHPTAFLGRDVRIGPRTVVESHVSIVGKTTIGANCRIGPGARIGQDGFGYERDDDGRWQQKPQSYGVVIGDDVHVGANTCIDRGSYRDTEIKGGARIDNLVHVAHNVIIGWDCVVVALSELSGSVELRNDSYVAPCACVREHLVIGEGAMVGLGAVVVKDVPPAVTVMGVPAKPKT